MAFARTRRTATLSLLSGWLLLLLKFSSAQLDDNSFRVAIEAFINDEATATSTYGPIEQWNVSAVTNFTHLGLNPDFQKDLSAWDVSNAIDMSQVRSAFASAFLVDNMPPCHSGCPTVKSRCTPLTSPFLFLLMASFIL